MEAQGKKIYCDYLSSDSSIPDEFALVSKSGLYEAKVQTDGNFVLYKHPENKVIWSSKTYGHGEAPYQLRCQSDGNVVLYDGRNTVIWNTNTHGKGQPVYKLIMQDDGNLVLKDGKDSIFWATWTKKV